MKFGQKRMMRYSLGVKTGLHNFGKFGSKVSAMASYAAPIAMAMGQPEIGSALEAGSMIGKGVSNIIKEI